MPRTAASISKPENPTYVRYWPKADICFALPNVLLGVKRTLLSLQMALGITLGITI